MDCDKFNDFITEYEARRLTKKQELEFLHHKDVCEECNVVFNLVFNDSQIDEINFMSVNNVECGVLVKDYEYSNNSNNSICSSVMEKIQNIEQNSYNFKFYNIMNIVFGVIVFGLIFILMFINKDEFYFMTNNFTSGTQNTVDTMSLGLWHVSNSAVNSVEQCALYLYVILIVCISVGYLYKFIKSINK